MNRYLATGDKSQSTLISVPFCYIHVFFMFDEMKFILYSLVSHFSYLAKNTTLLSERYIPDFFFFLYTYVKPEYCKMQTCYRTSFHGNGVQESLCLFVLQSCY